MAWRVAELSLRHYRTFGGPAEVTIPLGDKATGEVDAIAVLHGDNGTGKSNAIAGLKMFFSLFGAWQHPVNVRVDGWDWRGQVRSGPWDKLDGALKSMGLAPLRLSARDFAPGAPQKTMEVAVGLTGDDGSSTGGTALIRFLVCDLGDSFSITSEWTGPSALHDALRRRVFPPPGPRPFAVLNARRQLSWVDSDGGGLLHPQLAEDLFALRTSLVPAIRERWRRFVTTLQIFPTFQGKELTIERLEKSAAPVLVLEDRGRTVLRLEELSSGEQQLIVLSAGVLLANAAIVAIEEPELSLDTRNQARFIEILHQQINAGLVNQVILESHSPAFDGPQVLHFTRDSQGHTQVSRQPGRSPAQEQLEKQAREQGAQPRWVTREGFTQIPDQMRAELAIGEGGHVWFLKDKGRWQAWTEEELTEFFATKPEEPDA